MKSRPDKLLARVTIYPQRAALDDAVTVASLHSVSIEEPLDAGIRISGGPARQCGYRSLGQRLISRSDLNNRRRSLVHRTDL